MEYPIEADTRSRVFVTGGTGYIGQHLIPQLLRDNFQVTAVVRKGSEMKVPAGCLGLIADVLDGSTYADRVTPEHTFVHLAGVSHPSPAKARQFVEIDRRSAMEAIRVARERNAMHFVYVSVAHPAPVMKAYIAVREECEREILRSGLNSTILRPWYVLGPGHYWPYLLKPLYWLAERIPATSAGARRLGLVTIGEMVGALVHAVEYPAEGVEIVEPPGIGNSTAPRAPGAAEAE
ncbi:MAG: NAD(P)H-binding protein [Acidobacteriota bacterium]|nr:NAD(P)H-binding protein [Acidobacteriota bacterium]